MIQVSINKMGKLNMFSQCRRSINGHGFLNITINLEPLLLNLFQVTQIRLSSAELYAKIPGLVKILADPLCMFKMSSKWSRTKC